MRLSVRLVVATLFVWLSIAMALLGCNSSAADDEPLLGTWVPESGIFVASGPWRYAFQPDGKLLGYQHDDSTEPSGGGPYTIEEKWSDDAGNVYYHISCEWSPIPAGQEFSKRYYWTAKIDSTGDLMAANFSSVGYPEEASPAASGTYSEYRRQP